MASRTITASRVVAFLAAIMATGSPDEAARAQGHPQEVLDLVSAYDALAMKIRPLQDRVTAASPAGSTGFNPDGVPVRAAVPAAAEEGAAADQRVSERLRHKNRAATAGDDYGRIKVRLSALAEKVQAERERIMQPEFGAGTAAGDSEAGGVRFGDGISGARPASETGRQSAPPPRAAAPGTDALAESRRTLAALESEYAALENQVETLQRRQ